MIWGTMKGPMDFWRRFTSKYSTPRLGSLTYLIPIRLAPLPSNRGGWS